MRFPGFIGSSYEAEAVIAGSERCINLYLEPPGAQFARPSLYSAPGFRPITSASTSPIRGMFSQDGRAFFVAASALYELIGDTITLRGNVIHDDNPVTFSSNGDLGNQLFITSGNHGYVYDLNTDTLTDELTGAYQGGYVGGRFLALNTDESELQASGQGDGTTWDPTQVALRLERSDKWIAMCVAGGVIWLYGTKTSEVWYNAGTSPFPFALISGAVNEVGILAPFTAVPLGSVPLWLGTSGDGDAQVYQANGFAAVAISNYALDAAIRKAIQAGEDLSTAIAWTYQEGGHLFWVLDLPGNDRTWVYDATTQQWHERGHWDTALSKFTANRVRYHMVSERRHIVGDRASGSIYQQSLSYMTDVNSTILRRVRRAPHLNVEKIRMFYSALQVDMSVGVGLSDSESYGYDPSAMLHVSRDAGNAFWAAPDAQIGKLGKRLTRVQWNRLPGAVRDAVFEVVVTAPVPVCLTDAYLQFTKGTS